MKFFTFCIFIISVISVQAWYTTIVVSGKTFVSTLPKETSKSTSLNINTATPSTTFITSTNISTTSTTSTTLETTSSTTSSSTTTTTTVAIPTCVPSGGPCELINPAACCNEICFNSNLQPYCG